MKFQHHYLKISCSCYQKRQLKKSNLNLKDLFEPLRRLLLPIDYELNGDSHGCELAMIDLNSQRIVSQEQLVLVTNM